MVAHARLGSCVRHSGAADLTGEAQTLVNFRDRPQPDIGHGLIGAGVPAMQENLKLRKAPP